MSQSETKRSQKEESYNDKLLNKSKNSNEIEKKITEESKNTLKSKNNSNNEISKENYEENEGKKNINDEEIMIEVMDRGVNNDELNLSELERLVKKNKELQEILSDDKGNKLNDEKEIFNIIHDVSDISQTKKDLIKELTKNDEIKEILKNQNNELSNKIKLSEKKFQEIMGKISEKKDENIEQKLELQIKELEKEIKANNTETEHYKKLIDKIKDEIEFKEGVERASNLQKVLKQETLKNVELKNKFEILNKINKNQAKYMDNYQRKHKTKEKEEQLKNEILKNKNMIKDYNNKYLKLDRFTKIAHAKIMGIRYFIGKIINEPKILEEKKIFTNEETKDTLGIITNLKSQINEKRKELDEIQKRSDNKIHELLVKNKQIEIDFIENKRIYKNLLCKKNEINKKLRNINGGNKK